MVSTSRCSWSLIVLLSITFFPLLLLVQPALGQFFNFFGQQGPGGQAREQEAPPNGDASWFEARTEAATCQQYLCPRTLSCVPSPARCPCPFPQQIRCPYPDPISGRLEDGGSFCIQDSTGCAKIEKARGEWWDWKKLDQRFMKGF